MCRQESIAFPDKFRFAVHRSARACVIAYSTWMPACSCFSRFTVTRSSTVSAASASSRRRWAKAASAASVKDARVAGETEQRIYALNAWREAPFFSDRERAALEWAEAVTRIGETHAPDDLYELVRTQFSEEEFVALTFAVVVINSWNRLAISFRSPVGSYQPRAVPVRA